MINDFLLLVSFFLLAVAVAVAAPVRPLCLECPIR